MQERKKLERSHPNTKLRFLPMHEIGRENPPDFQAKFALNWSLLFCISLHYLLGEGWYEWTGTERTLCIFTGPGESSEFFFAGKVFFSRESEYEGWLFLAKSSLTFCEQKKSTTFRKSFINTCHWSEAILNNLSSFLLHRELKMETSFSSLI